MFLSHVVRVGGLKLGGDYPVRLQSMTRNDTRDVQATTAECIRAFEAGADLMRISVPDHASVKSLRQIKQKLKQSGFSQPLVADIHYHPELACEAARIVEKIRINPGNFDIARTRDQVVTAGHHQTGWRDSLFLVLRPLIEICKEHGTAIRIGLNHGSLPLHLSKRGEQPEKSLVESGIEYLKILESLGFYKTIVSLKTSSPQSMVTACRTMASRMLAEKMTYPIHIGVTEAGSGFSGRIRSALGIMNLLNQGIGNTIRVSLTETPEKETVFAKQLKKHATPGDTVYQISFSRPEARLTIHSEANDIDSLIADTVNQYVQFDNKEMVRDVVIDAPGIKEKRAIQEITSHLLQAAGIYAHETTFISCPACARVSMNMEELVSKVKKQLSGHPGYKIAIMGCMVNGPGEMTGADYGFICTGPGRVHVYKRNVPIKKNLVPDEAIKMLKQELSNPVADI